MSQHPKIKIIHEPPKLFIGNSRDSRYYIESFSPKYKPSKKLPPRRKLNLFKKQVGKSYARIEGITLEDKNLLEKVGHNNFNYANFIFQVIKLRTGAEVFFVTRTFNQDKSYYFIIEGDSKMTTIGTEEFYPVERAVELLIETINIHRKRGIISFNQKENFNDNVNNTSYKNNHYNRNSNRNHNNSNDWVVVKNGKRNRFPHQGRVAQKV